jgi:hypothetical protein
MLNPFELRRCIEEIIDLSINIIKNVVEKEDEKLLKTRSLLIDSIQDFVVLMIDRKAEVWETALIQKFKLTNKK